MRIAFFNDWRLGVVTDAGVVDVTDAAADVPRVGHHDLINGVIERWDVYKGKLEAAAKAGKATLLGEVKLLPPLPRPINIDCMAVNYMEDGTRPEAAPINGFPKSPNCIIGPGEAMVMTDIPMTSFEAEAELGLVIGKRGRNIASANWRDHVFGYVNFIDGSARGLPPPGAVFYQMKNRETFAPIGPWIVTADEVPDPQKLQVKLWVNGELRQNFNTSDMAHKIPRAIEWVSAMHTLNPGDIIATGTNHGGLSSLMDGDKVVLECDHCGKLEVSVRDDLKRKWPSVTRLQGGDRMKPSAQTGGKYAPGS
ncbi:MAG: fumarylacetoacetate hydrolase family protein [Alphaproteobacteria bacterium]|nr:fumarylacetoacetate hydrolase family protein [Alphaproteobacteria bacterium]